MKSKLLGTVLGLVFAAALQAEVTKEFPAHWGRPPEIQTRDFVELPAGYGHGSSTLKRWIAANLEKDQTAGKSPVSPVTTVLYRQDFQGLPAGTLPDEFMVLSGEFLVKADGTNQFLELPGAPLDSFAVQFGPAGKENISARARVFGTVKGRRAPTFGVGLGGVSGFKLQVSPAKKALELLKDQDLKSTVNYDWKSGAWTQLCLQIRQLQDGAWRIEGKAWSVSEPEPSTWTISFDEMEEPVSGKASVLGSPFAGTAICFDDLVVEKIGK